MEAWQKREGEQQELLEKLYETLITADDGGYESEMEILSFTHLLFETIIEERNSFIETTNDRILRLLNRINGFARVPAEAAVLKCRLLEMLIQYGFRQSRNELRKIGVHEPERLYAGHKAMDHVS